MTTGPADHPPHDCDSVAAAVLALLGLKGTSAGQSSVPLPKEDAT